MKKHLEYIENIERIIALEMTEGEKPITETAELFYRAVRDGRNIFLFGTGHSHMLAEELFYRAGGMANVRPILETSLMLHESASKSTKIERLEGYAQILFEQYKISSGDVVVMISNSGRNGVVVDMALLCREHGVKVVALTSMKHTLSGESRHRSGKRLFELADVVLDNMGEYGDASVSVDGIDGKVCPTSTVIGAMLLNAAMAGCFELCAENGIAPDHFSSSNIDGGDEINDRLVKKYIGEVPHL